MSPEQPESALPPIAIPAFSGPLDLLLHLIRLNEVSITDIPIAEITEQYTAYLDAMREGAVGLRSHYAGPASRAAGRSHSMKDVSQRPPWASSAKAARSSSDSGRPSAASICGR